VFLVKRVYEPPEPGDGRRFLVERLWPRGVAKTPARWEAWLKEVAPSSVLRLWFGHEVEKWEEFRRRYFAELDAKPETWRPLLTASREGNVTLLYSARDQAHNSAVALKEYLEAQTPRSSQKSR
jgi:uncharacterized protein YeaO (DUF488 family)